MHLGDPALWCSRAITAIFLLTTTLCFYLTVSSYYPIVQYRRRQVRTSRLDRIGGTTAPCGPLRFSSDPLPRVALASFPGSGNTWTRHLIEQCTGIYTGSIYCDSELMDDFPGECVRNRSLIVIKTHLDPWTFGKKPFEGHMEFEKAIVIIRNPFEALKAMFNNVYARDGEKHVGLSRFPMNGSKWLGYLPRAVERWRLFHMLWLRAFRKPVLVIKYEDIKKDLKTQLRKINSFLGFEVEEARLDCVVEHSVGKFKREKGKDEQQAFFSEEISQIIKSDVQKIQAALQEL